MIKDLMSKLFLIASVLALFLLASSISIVIQVVIWPFSLFYASCMAQSRDRL